MQIEQVRNYRYGFKSCLAIPFIYKQFGGLILWPSKCKKKYSSSGACFTDVASTHFCRCCKALEHSCHIGNFWLLGWNHMHIYSLLNPTEFYGTYFWVTCQGSSFNWVCTNMCNLMRVLYFQSQFPDDKTIMYSVMQPIIIILNIISQE